MTTPSSIIMILLGAGLAGAAIGTGSILLDAPGRERVAALGATAIAATRPRRARPPRPGDAWGGCNDARAAGTAPIYRNEPGYRRDMDGDGDGIACEARPD